MILIIADIPGTNVGDAIIAFAPLMKFAHTLRNENKEFEILIPMNSYTFRGELLPLIDYMISLHELSESVRVVDIDNIDEIGNVDLYVHYNIANGCIAYKSSRENIKANTKITSFLSGELPIDYEYFDMVINTSHYNRLQFPIWFNFNEVNRIILSEYFDIECDETSYLLDLNWGFDGRPDYREIEKRFIFHVCDDPTSALRWTNDEYIEFIREVNSYMKSLPKLTFIIHNNEESVKKIVDSIDNDVEYVEGSLKDVAEYINQKASIVITHSTGILHIAAALMCSTTELSKSQNYWHGMHWCPPCGLNKHFIIEPHCYIFSSVVDIDIKKAASNFHHWLIKQGRCPVESAMSAHKMMYADFKSLKDRLTPEEISSMIWSAAHKSMTVNEFKF